MDAEIFAKARLYALDQLTHKLAPHFYYHNLGHTCDDVVPAVETFAQHQGVQGEAYYLIVTAAWYHDIGFIEQAPQHEFISGRIAGEVLPGFGYTAAQVKIIQEAIYATALPQSPNSPMAEILTDADLDVLGREDFLTRNAELRREIAFLGKTFTDLEWYSGQLKFLEGHTYFTQAARTIRNEGKAKNVVKFRKIFETFTK
jgi:uncharacterized protein